MIQFTYLHENTFSIELVELYLNGPLDEVSGWGSGIDSFRIPDST